MRKVVVSDTSCFIALTNIGELDLLYKLYHEVYSTPEIEGEFIDSLPEWVKILPVKDRQKQQLLEFQIDKGEASAIALALEIGADLVILDDFKARIAAERMGLQITGTLGAIIKAKKNGIIESIRPALEKLIKTDFRLSDALIEEALKEAGEY